MAGGCCWHLVARKVAVTSSCAEIKRGELDVCAAARPAPAHCTSPEAHGGPDATQLTQFGALASLLLPLIHPKYQFNGSMTKLLDSSEPPPLPGISTETACPTLPRWSAGVEHPGGWAPKSDHLCFARHFGERCNQNPGTGVMVEACLRLYTSDLAK